nr:uncharacterized protein LOC129417300 [Misgurnus anguillicaudatus]
MVSYLFEGFFKKKFLREMKEVVTITLEPVPAENYQDTSSTEICVMKLTNALINCQLKPALQGGLYQSCAKCASPCAKNAPLPKIYKARVEMLAEDLPDADFRATLTSLKRKQRDSSHWESVMLILHTQLYSWLKLTGKRLSPRGFKFLSKWIGWRCVREWELKKGYSNCSLQCLLCFQLGLSTLHEEYTDLLAACHSQDH